MINNLLSFQNNFFFITTMKPCCTTIQLNREFMPGIDGVESYLIRIEKR